MDTVNTAVLRGLTDYVRMDINRSISLFQLLSEQEWPRGTMINASVKCYKNQMVEMEEEGKVLSLPL